MLKNASLQAAVLATLGLSGFLVAPLGAQGQSDDHLPFTINGHTWASKADFIEHGRIEPALADQVAKRGAKRAGAALQPAAQALPPVSGRGFRGRVIHGRP